MMGYGWNHGYWGPGFFGGGFLGWIIPVLFWVVVIFLFISLFRHNRREEYHGRHEEHEENGDNAMNILRERYAKGEIDKKQFDAMKKDLM
jgi:putative membrane protein